MTRAAILGASGYTALELAKILLRHPGAGLVAATSRERQPLAHAHPSLLGRTDLVARPHSARDLKDLNIDVAFLALPHGASREAVGPLLGEGIRVIDLSADYRLKDPAVYRKYYGEDHGDPDNLAHAVYGLPELNAEAIRTARLIANPGCYPQTGILGLAPLFAAGLISPDGVVVNSVSGVSGAGRTPKLATLFPECNENVSAYNVGVHRHAPEMDQLLSPIAKAAVEVLFCPHLVPMDRGIHSTIVATPTGPVSEHELLGVMAEYYAGKPFVRVKPGYPATKDTAHTNFIDLSARFAVGKIIVLAAEDNLVRGASGVAVQNMNLMFGHPETAGLW